MFIVVLKTTIFRFVVALSVMSACCYADVSEDESISKASALSRSGMTEEAKVVLRSAVAAHPNSASLHGALGKVLFREQNYEQAVPELGFAAKQLPDSPEYNMLLAEALIGWGHFSVAVEFLNAVRPRFRNEAQFHYDLGLAYYNLKKMTPAHTEIEEALQLNPQLDTAQYLLGGCLIAAGDYPGALREFRMLVREKPRKATYWAALGQVLQTSGSQVEALRAIRHALILAPSDDHVQYVAATVFTESGNFAKARPYWERLEKLDPSVLAVHVQLARVYSRLGERALARQETELVNELRARNSSVESAGDQLVPGAAKE